MRLKLTLERGGGRPSVDLLVTVEASSTVGALADHLARADPDGGSTGPRTSTLALAGSEHALAPRAALVESGLRSGSVVRLAPAGKDAPLGEAVTQAAVARVLSGPDQGREFPVPRGTSVIGRESGCEVRLSDPLVSRQHARLHITDVVEIVDLGSANGILVGDDAVDRAVLRPSDTVRLGDTVLAVRLRAGGDGAASRNHSTAFNRPPRIGRRFAGRTFALPALPATPRGQRFPILPLFAPLLMGAALYLTTKSASSIIFMAMSPLMMAGNVVEGQVAGRRTHRRDVQKFRDAIAALRAEAGREAVVEAETRRAEYPSLAECAEAIRTRGLDLWSRRPDLPGFGELSLGLGVQPSRSKVDYPFNRNDEPDLLGELHQAFNSFATIDGVPVVVKLDGAGALGVAGPPDRARAIAAAFMLQLTAMHSHAQLAVYSVCGSVQAREWEWLKWLPHCGGLQSPLSCQPLASTKPNVARLLGELETTIRTRTEASRSGDGGPLPRLVLLVDGPLEAERSRIVDLAERGTSCGVWVIWVAEAVSALPACCKTFVEVSPADGGCAAGFVDTSETVEPLLVERLALSETEELARLMSPIVDASLRDDSQSDVPRSVSLLALVGRDLAVGPDRIVERWVENRSLLTGARAIANQGQGRPGNLRALIGESATGPHVLDLTVHGPHALVGGTTGSGKSEMLQSWIVAMALSNSPQRLTFLLVDYKGGSAFSDCVNLPHTVGLVTDLRPHLVRRALTSLSAELRYREHILARKRAKDLASLERVGDPEAPPRLVIVVDEFAALVQEVPEFVDGVVNVAQRGRSLGLHLILATQRPSGVIRDNLRANTNLRIALRVADAADSTDVIGSKVAASFDPTIPGRAASRTGPTALIPFQTGYVGGWTSSAPDRPDIAVTTWGFSPTLTWEPPVDTAKEQPAEGPTDIQRLVASIGEANRMAEIAEPRKPWLSELAAVYDLARLPSHRRDDELAFAVADDPANQRQFTMAFRPDTDGNMAIFGTGNSGKSTLLRTLCVASGVTVRGGPVHVYGLDFGARGLQMLEQLPHVGAVIPGNDFERVYKLVFMIRELIDRRGAEYARVGAGSVTQYRTITGRADEPRILLLVDGMGGMRTAYEGTEHHRVFETFLSIAADGRQVGVHVIIAADRAGAVPTALGSHIQRRVVLRLAEGNDYSMLGQANDVLDAKSPPGRGLCDGLEIQVAILGDSPDVLMQDIAVRTFANAMRRAGASVAPAVRRLEDEIWLEDLPVDVDGGPAFAVSRDTLAARGLPTAGTFTLAGPPGSGRTTALMTLARSFRRWRPDTRLVYFGSKRSPLVGSVEWDRSALDAAAAAQLALEVPAFLGEAGGQGAPGVVIIENLLEFVQGPADGALQEMLKKVTGNGHLVVSDGEPMPLSGLQPLVQSARASRVGLVLQPEQADGVLFRVQFPRVKKPDFPAGRGLYVARGELPSVVQVAREGSAPR